MTGTKDASERLRCNRSNMQQTRYQWLCASMPRGGFTIIVGGSPIRSMPFASPVLSLVSVRVRLSPVNSDRATGDRNISAWAVVYIPTVVIRPPPNERWGFPTTAGGDSSSYSTDFLRRFPSPSKCGRFHS